METWEFEDLQDRQITMGCRVISSIRARSIEWDVNSLLTLFHPNCYPLRCEIMSAQARAGHSRIYRPDRAYKCLLPKAFFKCQKLITHPERESETGAAGKQVLRGVWAIWPGDFRWESNWYKIMATICANCFIVKMEVPGKKRWQNVVMFMHETSTPPRPRTSSFSLLLGAILGSFVKQSPTAFIPPCRIEFQLVHLQNIQINIVILIQCLACSILELESVYINNV